MLRTSMNAGVTWSNPLRIHAENANSQFLPAIAVDQSSGIAAVAWYDARNAGANNDQAQIYATLVGVGPGNVPTKLTGDIQIGAALSNSHTLATPGGQFNFGDYMGIAFGEDVLQNKVFFPVWADNSNSTNDNADGTGFEMDLYTARVQVNWTNIAPVGTSAIINMNEDTTYALNAADFGFSDASDSPPNNFQAVLIANLSGNGTLTNNGTVITAATTVSLSDIDSGLLVFQPDTDANGTAYGTISFRVQDSGGTANGGIDLDTTARTLTINVTAVNDAPVNSVLTSPSTSEDINFVFTGSDLISVADVDAGSTFQLTLTATNGTLTLSTITGLNFSFADANGTAAGDGTADVSMTFRGALSAINAALDGMTFAPTANFHGNATVQLISNDLGSTGSGSVKTDNDTMTITVNAVNDAPLNTVPGLQTANEDTPIVFSTAHGNAISIADVDAGATMQIFISALTTGGTMTLSGTTGLDFSFSDAYATGLGDGTADESMCFRGSVSAINAALQGLTFTPAANWEGTNYIYTIESYDFTLLDSDQVELYFTPINDAPTGINHTVYTAQNTDYVIVATDFGFSDIDNDALLAVRITGLASSGALWWHTGTSWTTVSDEQEVSAADILNNKLKYVPPANTTGTATFTFRIRDDGGTANGGSDTDLTDRTLTLDII